MKLFVLWALTIACMGLIAYLSHDSDLAKMVWLRYGLDKVLYVMEFSILGGLLFLSFCASSEMEGRAFRKKRYTEISIWTISCTSVYALSDEVHQIWVPGRVSSMADFVADFVGIVIAVLALSEMKKRKRRRRV